MDNYRENDGCWNCRYSYLSEDDMLYCDVAGDRPPFAPVPDDLVENDIAWSPELQAWYEWATNATVAFTGICDLHQP